MKAVFGSGLPATTCADEILYKFTHNRLSSSQLVAAMFELIFEALATIASVISTAFGVCFALVIAGPVLVAIAAATQLDKLLK